MFITSPNGEELVEKTPEFAAYQSKVMYTAKLRKSNLPVMNYSFDTYVGKDTQNNIIKFKKYVDEFNATFKSISLYMWSKQNGTQKTTMARTIGALLIKNGFTVQSILMDSLIKLSVGCNFEEEPEQLKLCKSVDFLIIDDAFDSKKVTLYKSGYQLPYLDTFLRERLEGKRKAICFTSNISIMNIATHFGQSIQELVVRSSQEFSMTDYIESRNNFSSLWD